MKVKIKKSAYVHTSNITRENPEKMSLRKYLLKTEGTWVEIDTDYLFDNQYNTKSGYRISDNMIDAIEDDARVINNKYGIGYCGYCGQKTTEHQPCHPEYFKSYKIFPHAKKLPVLNGVIKDDYNNLIDWKKQNIFIDKHCTVKNINNHYWRASTGRASIEFVLDEDLNFWIHNGIGYKKENSLPCGKVRDKKIRNTMQKLYRKYVWEKDTGKIYGKNPAYNEPIKIEHSWCNIQTI